MIVGIKTSEVSAILQLSVVTPTFLEDQAPPIPILGHVLGHNWDRGVGTWLVA